MCTSPSLSRGQRSSTTNARLLIEPSSLPTPARSTSKNPPCALFSVLCLASDLLPLPILCGIRHTLLVVLSAASSTLRACLLHRHHTRSSPSSDDIESLSSTRVATPGWPTPLFYPISLSHSIRPFHSNPLFCHICLLNNSPSSQHHLARPSLLQIAPSCPFPSAPLQLVLPVSRTLGFILHDTRSGSSGKAVSRRLFKAASKLALTSSHPLTRTYLHT